MSETIEFDGVLLSIKQTGKLITLTKVVGKDRLNNADITNSVSFKTPCDFIDAIKQMRHLSKLTTACCNCDYRYGWSDNAEHCRSIDVARYIDGIDD